MLFGPLLGFIFVHGRLSHRWVRDPRRREAKEGGRFVREYGCVKVQKSRTFSTEMSFVVYESRKDGHRYIVMDWLTQTMVASNRTTVRLTPDDARQLLALFDEAAMVGVVK